MSLPLLLPLLPLLLLLLLLLLPASRDLGTAAAGGAVRAKEASRR
jgi:hypothetical protein